jgi:sugar phosphate isomerase/epimerase
MTETIDRRAFVSRAALGAAALAYPLGSWRRDAGAPSGMFVSMPPWAVARKVGWPEQARLAARVGYAGIDWAFGPAKSAGVEATRALLTELAIVPTIVNLPMRDPLGADDAAFEAQLPLLREDAAFCQAIGCGRFQFVLGPTTPNGQAKADRWAHVQRRLSSVAAILAQHDMRLGLEFLGPIVFRMRRGPDPMAPNPVPFVWTLTETLALGVASGPNVGVTLDAWHWFHSGGTLDEIRAAPAARIVHVHVSDARRMPAEQVQDDMRLLPGEGVIDLVGFFQALRSIGYQGGVAPETIGPRLPDTMPAEESARLGLESTRAVMQRAGVL